MDSAVAVAQAIAVRQPVEQSRHMIEQVPRQTGHLDPPRQDLA
jgi:hypothetical protein